MSQLSTLSAGAALILPLLLVLSCTAPGAGEHGPSNLPEEAMLKGLRTAIYSVDDIARAKSWYSEVLGKDPYFDEAYYVGFDVGGYELGLVPEEGEHATGSGTGVVAYWGVDEIEAAIQHLQEHGAEVHAEIQDVGEGIMVATVRDPYGNLLGVIENPHFEVK